MVDQEDEFDALLVLFNDWIREVDRLRNLYSTVPWWRKKERTSVRDQWENALNTATEIFNQLIDAFTEKYGTDPRIKRSG
jgi:hypothetical protein